jgi:hypothetical protein
MSLPATFHLTVVNPGSTLVSTLSSFWTWGHSCLDCQMPLHMLYHCIPTWDGSWAQTTVGIAGSCVFWGSRLNTSALCKCRHLTVTSSYVAESDYNFILGKHWAAYTYNGCRVFYMVNKELCVPWILRMQFTLERCLYYLFDYLFIYLLTNGLKHFQNWRQTHAPLVPSCVGGNTGPFRLFFVFYKYEQIHCVSRVFISV